jgi:hypothetical protein
MSPASGSHIARILVRKSRMVRQVYTLIRTSSGMCALTAELVGAGAGFELAACIFATRSSCVSLETSACSAASPPPLPPSPPPLLRNAATSACEAASWLWSSCTPDAAAAHSAAAGRICVLRIDASSDSYRRSVSPCLSNSFLSFSTWRLSPWLALDVATSALVSAPVDSTCSIRVCIWRRMASVSSRDSSSSASISSSFFWYCSSSFFRIKAI